MIDKKRLQGKLIEMLEREINISKQLDNEYVLVVKEVVQTESTVMMVMDYIAGGELFEILKNEGILSLHQNIRIITQVCEAVKYLHSLKICHRDIKPENILCTSSEEPFDIKLSDFGLSKQYRSDMLSTSCGTLHYAPPEIVGSKGNYNESCDMWSVGVLTFVLLTGNFPFNGSDEEVEKKIMTGSIDWDRVKEKDICEEAKDFISHLIVVKPENRLTAEQCLEHQFLHILDVEEDILYRY